MGAFYIGYRNFAYIADRFIVFVSGTSNEFEWQCHIVPKPRGLVARKQEEEIRTPWAMTKFRNFELTVRGL